MQPPSSPVKLSANVSGSTSVAGSPQADFNNCRTATPTAAATSGGWPFGAAWWWARSGQTRYNHVMPPNTWSCDFGGDNADSDSDAISAGSRHPGAVNTLFLDGSVRAIKNSHQQQHLVGHQHHVRRRGDLGRRLLTGPLATAVRAAEKLPGRLSHFSDC